MDDRGKLHWFLGMRILRSHDKITVDQKKYIESVLQQFNMSDCKAAATPGEVNLKLIKSNDDQKLVDAKLYRSLVGSLLFIGKQTRPDILHIVNQLSRFLDKPDISHWKAAKHVLRYLKGTIDLQLTFLKNSNLDIVGDSDADWSGDLNDRKSTTGYYFKFEGNGGAISWEVKKQATVALSSTKPNIKLWRQLYKKQYIYEH
ncbi:secreted RxLR effector protein 161-like [Xenia sp. Carnegie-2017]|uniref:secreted RxLR effector protein 161-like n=1 Tax=Xenia sp. Carnegie-2017 TaxID=2897299 RepID=UPI001F041840|nr:secreted RxLR effector protein 161-like [Xenia sp. Carnegie-2017]